MTARPVVSVDARLAEIEQHRARALGALITALRALPQGAIQTGCVIDSHDAIKRHIGVVIHDDVPWLVSQLRDARAENERLIESLDRIAGERVALCKERNDARHLAECTNEARKAATRERNKMGARAASAEATLAAVRELADRTLTLGGSDLEAQLLREVAERDPEAHNRALARAYGVGPAQDEPKRCEHGFTEAHAVIETSFAPPPHPRCPGPVSQPTEGSEQ